MPYTALSSLLRVGIVVATVMLPLIFMLTLEPWVEMSSTPFLLFFSAVMLSAGSGGWNSGLLANSLSVVFSDYFFLLPKYELSFDITNLVKITLFILEGLILTAVFVALRNAKHRDEVNLQKLKTSDARFRLALSNSDIVVFQQDQNLRYQWIHNLQGTTAAEILGKSDYELFPPEIAEQLTTIKRRVLENDVAAREEVRVILRGQVLYYDLLVETLKINEQIQGITCVAINTTQRQQVEQEKAKLRQSLQEAIQQKEEYLALLNAWLASSPVALAFLDTELRYVYVNETLAAINGVPQSQHIGRTFREVLPNWADQIEPILLRVMSTKEPLLNQEIRGETYQSGVYCWGLVSYYPVCLPDGQLLGLGVTSLDITQKKLTEQALSKSEALFRAMFDQAALGIALISLDGKFLQVNPALCRLTGYSYEELIQMRFQDITHPDDLVNDWNHAQRVVTQEISSYSLEKRYIRKDGSIIWVNLTSSAVCNDEGEAQYAFGIVEDISDRQLALQETQQAKQAAEMAANRTARLQSVTAAFSEALTPQQVADVVVNQGIGALGAVAGSVVLIEAGGKSLKIVEAIGYPDSVRESWASFPITANVPIAVAARTGKPIFLENIAALASQYPAIANVPYLTGNCAFACIPLIVEQQTIGVLGLSFAKEQEFTDENQRFMLTLAQQAAQAIARAQLYEAEKNARAAAESANRVKDEFLTVLSHELRTPLNPILGWAKLLRTRKYNEATITQALETIERNAKLQTQLIDDLLDVSRILQGKLNLNIGQVDLRTAILAALETVRLAADAKSIPIHTLLDEDISPVKGDSDRLQQVFWNLLSNAVKFTPPGGRVEVRLEKIEEEAQIQVIDTGKGITPEFLPYVFEYFRQADSKTTRVEGGIGLGLAIVRHFVEIHGGTVKAESPGLGQGATFTVRLPLGKG
ncbi:ATPase [Nostoc sp. CENA543]|uniref:PAS domain S-box protein n=1 Tax=Nostoc sp. CENA543 TaxID=1869241 RepID=UPI000CA13752|nr:PAS domain S-box protein [Nostoc sp. CENA543]AUT03022.1 ATPase [Nostoc sp. CENA543]